MIKPSNKLTRGEEVALSALRVSERYRTVRTLFRVAGGVLAAYLLGISLAPFAGENTAVTVALNILADVKFALTITLAGAASTWAVFERIAKQRKTKYLQDRIIELETTIDPNRSSSGLTRSGKTNPRDRRD
ncbi:hypothetical protein ACFYE8_05145 [Rhizobium leguminosarum]|uniref:hypothetical protein n=1 Tax=Rhizobium leguminosarum TaxID=384 RepID=UPI0036D98417